VILDPGDGPRRRDRRLHLQSNRIPGYYSGVVRSHLRLRPKGSRWYDSWSRYLALLAAAVTLLTTTIVFFVTDKTIGGVKDLVAACIALLGFVIALQLETLFRVSERAHTREQSGRLLEMVEDHPHLLSVAIRLLDASVTTLKQTQVDEFKDEVLSILLDADVRMQELAQGRLRTAGGDSTLILDRFRGTTRVLQGITDDGDTEWWSKGNGTKFRELNKRLIQDHNVRIDRFWILNDTPDDKTRAVIEEHDRIGVNVFLVRAKDEKLDHRLLVNMTMMDGAFLHEDLPNKKGEAVEYLFSENPADLKRASSRFAQLRAHATEYKDASSIDCLFRKDGSP